MLDHATAVSVMQAEGLSTDFSCKVTTGLLASLDWKAADHGLGVWYGTCAPGKISLEAGLGLLGPPGCVGGSCGLFGCMDELLRPCFVLLASPG